MQIRSALSHCLVGLALLTPTSFQPVGAEEFTVRPLSDEQATEYNLSTAFYRKGTMAEGILIATSDRVSDVAHQEAAYQFSMIMRSISSPIAQSIREKKVLCILIGHDELTSQLPQFASDKTGRELDFYNWRSRGFLTHKNGRADRRVCRGRRA